MDAGYANLEGAYVILELTLKAHYVPDSIVLFLPTDGRLAVRDTAASATSKRQLYEEESSASALNWWTKAYPSAGPSASALDIVLLQVRTQLVLVLAQLPECARARCLSLVPLRLSLPESGLSSAPSEASLRVASQL
jgi:hypothetical protein